MANLNEENTFEEAIFRLETDTPVQGGAPSFDGSGNPDGGYSNIQALQLANRTAWLKNVIDNLGDVVDLDFGTEPDEVPQNQNLGSAAYRDTGGGADNVPQNSDLGSASTKETGTDPDNVPQNSDLGSAAYEDDSKYLPASVLRGSVSAFAMDTPPSGYLACNGAAVSRDTYSELFNLIGTTFGNGDGSTTFNLPDLRGEFIRGFDDGRGVDGGRSFGDFQDFTMEAHKHLSASIFENNTVDFVNGNYEFDIRGGTDDPFVSGGGNADAYSKSYIINLSVAQNGSSLNGTDWDTTVTEIGSAANGTSSSLLGSTTVFLDSGTTDENKVTFKVQTSPTSTGTQSENSINASTILLGTGLNNGIAPNILG